MEAKESAVAWNLHPIKLRFIHLKKVDFQVLEVPENLPVESRNSVAPTEWILNVRSSVSHDSAVVIAGAKCIFKRENAPEPPRDAQPQDGGGTETTPEKADPYLLEIQAIGGFSFDPAEIQRELVQEWCQKGSFFIFAPYLRSAIAGITRESGFPEVILPLLEVPTFRPPPKVEKTAVGDTASKEVHESPKKE